MSVAEEQTLLDALKIRGVQALLVAGIGLNVVLWLLAFFVFPRDEVAAVLHYQAARGIDFIGDGTQITVLPLIGLLLLVINGVVGAATYSADRRTSWILWSSIPVFQLVLAVAFYFVWQAN